MNKIKIYIIDFLFITLPIFISFALFPFINNPIPKLNNPDYNLWRSSIICLLIILGAYRLNKLKDVIYVFVKVPNINYSNKTLMYKHKISNYYNWYYSLYLATSLIPLVSFAFAFSDKPLILEIYKYFNILWLVSLIYSILIFKRIVSCIYKSIGEKNYV